MKKILLIALILANLTAKETYNLESSIKKALENNKSSKISKIALEIAKVQYQQSKSANYPSLDLKLVLNRMKNDTLFDVHSSYKADAKTARALAFSSSLDPAVQASTGLTAAQLQAGFASGGIPIPDVVIPLDFETKVAGRDTALAVLEMIYPLYTGGKISSIQKQAKLNTLLAQTSIKRVNTNVVFDVKQYFYAYALTSQLYMLSQDVYTRMKNLEDLTKQFLEEAESLNIKKTDYLNMQLKVVLISSKVSEIQIKKELAKSALMNVMGLKYDDEVEFDYKDKNIRFFNKSLENTIKHAYENNNDIKKVKLAVKIYDAKILEKQAGHYPDIALLADIKKGYNSYEYSAVNDSAWSLSVVAKIPLFKGFKTSNEIKEKKLEKKRILEEQETLEDALATLIKNEVIKASLTYKQIQSLTRAKELAVANRDLNTRAYRVDAVTPKEVVEAQLTEAYVKLDYEKYVHDYLLSLAKIEKLVGLKIEQQ